MLSLRRSTAAIAQFLLLCGEAGFSLRKPWVFGIIAIWIVAVYVYFLNTSSQKGMYSFFQKESHVSETCAEHEISKRIFQWKTEETIVRRRMPLYNFHTYKKGHVAQCRVPKSMHTVVEYIFGFLSNSSACNLTGIAEFKMDKTLARCQTLLVHLPNIDELKTTGTTRYNKTNTTDQPTRDANNSSSIVVPFSTLFSSTKSQKIAVVVPFRNGHSQLATYLKHMHWFFKQQQLPHQILIIEQVEQQLFNRGKLLNIGFVEASRRYPFFTCFVFHDVDLLPLTDHNHIVYNCSDKGPVHLASAIDKFNYKMPYATYFGGACMFTPDQFTKINGFSNKFWGWGGEDDEAYIRTVLTNQEIRHFPPSVLRFKTMKHRKDHNIYYRQHVTLLNKARENRTRMKNYEYDGLSSLNYKLISNITLPFYVNVTVDLLPKHYYSYNVELINF